MSPDPVSPLPDDLQELIVDVVDGRYAVDDDRVRAAGAQQPEFAEALAGALQVARCLDALRRDEAMALGAPPSQLDAIAEAAVRQRLQLVVGQARRWRLPRWVPLVLAAALVLAVVWFGFFDGGRGRRPGDEHLGQPGAVAIAFDAEHHELVLGPAPGPGESYRVEFGSGEVVLETVRDVRSARLSVPDLRRYLPDLWVHAVLREAGEDAQQSGRVPVPVDFWR